MKKVIILDPGHGLSNKRAGAFDPGAVSNGVRESDVAMAWCNELRSILLLAGHKVVRTRTHDADPAPVGKRANIAKEYGGDIMLSIHCNAANGEANGTETFYRGLENKPKAEQITLGVCNALGTRNRGAKTESQSQHARLAVMSFQPCFLLEIGFIDNSADRARMLDPTLRYLACAEIAKAIS